jgi:hypothetical protein
MSPWPEAPRLARPALKRIAKGERAFAKPIWNRRQKQSRQDALKWLRAQGFIRNTNPRCGPEITEAGRLSLIVPPPPKPTRFRGLEGYTMRESAIISKLYAEYGASPLSERFNRTPKAIRVKAYRLRAAQRAICEPANELA